MKLAAFLAVHARTTEEMKVSHIFRRLTMIAQQFGDTDYHLERFAAGGSGAPLAGDEHAGGFI